ncbi:LysR substrate-binding domain-containing protein [Caballeronia sp. INDeC2]|uniref:LysR substrate-binding domain-containing protein n=1 Tax=Caballeronia sp. INDeC2 TaxID=2921747 RepID=UPI002028108F|nr:LysR substrate-binding domain-containing protein [Caballeronia sp. INDeC2]
MELRHLRYFLAVAEEGHFGRAARRLNIVQPALSMQIRALEAELGGALLVRTSRKVALTEAGETLVIEARRTLAQADRTMAIVQRSLRGETGQVRVGFAGNAVLAGRLMQDMRLLRASYPTIRLELVELAPHLQSDALIAGRIDVGYCPRFGIRLEEQLDAEKIGEWPMSVAMADTHAFAHRRSVSLAAISSEPLIAYAPGDGEDSAAMLRLQFGLNVNVAHRVSSTLSVLALAAAGMGIALVPASLEQVNIPHLVFRSLKDSAVSADLLLLNRKHEADPAVRAFLSLMRTPPLKASTNRGTATKPR